MKELLQLETDFQRGRWLLIAAFSFSLIVALTAVGLAFKYSNEFMNTPIQIGSASI